MSNATSPPGQQVRSMVDRVIEKFGRIDILVNDAAVSPPERSFVDITEEQWDKVLAVNLKGVFLCCQAVVPHMKKQKYGKIVNVGSVGAIAPSKTIADYCIAKSGVLMLTQCLALEFAEDNICVNALLPGITRTDFHDAIRPEGRSQGRILRWLGEDRPDGESSRSARTSRTLPCSWHRTSPGMLPVIESWPVAG